jgi:hypothetical protein
VRKDVPVTYDAAECLKCIQACWRVREKDSWRKKPTRVPGMRLSPLS